MICLARYQTMKMRSYFFLVVLLSQVGSGHPFQTWIRPNHRTNSRLLLVEFKMSLVDNRHRTPCSLRLNGIARRSGIAQRALFSPSNLPKSSSSAPIRDTATTGTWSALAGENRLTRQKELVFFHSANSTHLLDRYNSIGRKHHHSISLQLVASSASVLSSQFPVFCIRVVHAVPTSHIAAHSPTSNPLALRPF